MSRRSRRAFRKFDREHFCWGFPDGSFAFVPAQGIEAASAGETVKQGSTEGESPVAEGDAPKGGRHG
jgi:hypothetical protein